MLHGLLVVVELLDLQGIRRRAMHRIVANVTGSEVVIQQEVSVLSDLVGQIVTESSKKKPTSKIWDNFCVFQYFFITISL